MIQNSFFLTDIGLMSDISIELGPDRVPVFIHLLLLTDASATAIKFDMVDVNTWVCHDVLRQRSTVKIASPC